MKVLQKAGEILLNILFIAVVAAIVILILTVLLVCAWSAGGVLVETGLKSMLTSWQFWFTLLSMGVLRIFGAAADSLRIPTNIGIVLTAGALVLSALLGFAENGTITLL